MLRKQWLRIGKVEKKEHGDEINPDSEKLKPALVGWDEGTTADWRGFHPPTTSKDVR